MLIVPRPCRAGLVVPYKKGNPPLVTPRTGCETGGPALELRITAHGLAVALDVTVPNGGFVDMTQLGGGPPLGLAIELLAQTTTFEILNAGTADLNLGVIAVSDAGGTIAITPVVSTPPGTPVAPAAVTSFVVTWAPAGDANTADLLLSIPSDDPNSPYTATIRTFVVGVV